MNCDKLIARAEEILKEAESNDLINEPAQYVFINAPVALQQVHLKAVANTCRKILGKPLKMYCGKD